MKRFFLSAVLSVTLLLAGSVSAFADSGVDAVITAMEGTNWDVKPEIAFLRKTTKFVVPEANIAQLTNTEGYGGAKFAYIFGRDMIKYFEANGYPNLRQGLAAGATDQIDAIAAKYSFEFVYEGAADQKSWNMFNNYSSLIRDDLFHWGWMPKSGEAHFIVTTTPKASAFSATSDGKTFKLSNPVIEIPTSQWGKTAKPVLDKYGTQGNRI